MKWIAVIVLWNASPIEWGIISQDTQAKCIEVEQQVRAKHGTEQQSCIRVSDKVLKIMSGKVGWASGPDNPIVYACSRRHGCNEVGG